MRNQGLVERDSTDRSVTLEPVGEGEFAILRELSGAIWRRHYPAMISTAQIEYMLARRFADDLLREICGAADRWLELLRVDSVPVGYCGYELSRERPEAMRLGQLYLLEGHRGRGLGRLMLRRVEDRARGAGRSSIVLQVNRNNADAIRFYRGRGFTVVREAVFDIGSGFVMDDFVMEKRV